MEIHRILVPVDFSERSIKALAYAIDLACTTAASIDVLHVWEPPAYVAPEMMVTLTEEVGHRTVAELARREVGKEMRLLLQAWEDRTDVSIRGRLEIGSVPETIVEIALGGNYDLLVMATHGRTGLSRLVLGSVTEEVIRTAPCPVLSVPAGNHHP